MSSYLNIFIKRDRNDKEEKPYCLTSFSRSSDVYSLFHDNLGVTFCGTEGDKYTELDEKSFLILTDDIKDSLAKYGGRLNEYEKYASQNEDYIGEILSLKDEIRNLQELMGTVRCLQYIQEDTNKGVMLCNID